jgi:DNA helicase IV
MEAVVLFAAALSVVCAGLFWVVRSRGHAREQRLSDEAHSRDVAHILALTVEDLFRDAYISASELAAWVARNSEPLLFAKRTELAILLPVKEAHTFRQNCERLQDLERSVRNHNVEFVARRIGQDRDLFDRVERYPLTLNQRRAIVTNEDTTLVVAGAGTGKTSTILGKVDYLIRHGMARPHEILVLTFTRKASDELKTRLRELGVQGNVNVSTFHSLGNRIIGMADGRRPSVSKMAEDDQQLLRFIRSQVGDMLSTPEGYGLIMQWFSRYLDEPELDESDLTGDQRLRDESSRGLRDLKGQRLKSREEVKIANWLTLNGIEWEYERRYHVDTADKDFKSYQPDFYLNEYDIYVEHFGIGCNGLPAPYVDRERYLQSMAWKRALHDTYGTCLIETTSCDNQRDQLIERLSEQLENHGVGLRRLTPEEVERITHEGNRAFSIFVELLAQFLNVYKGNSWSRHRLESRARTERDRVFLEIFDQIYDAYSSALTASQTIDFHDMINMARLAVQGRRFIGAYKYIIVDEFQDISENRLGLLQDLRNHVPHARLFVVGDDWQSIFRFAGSDVGIVTHLSERVGTTARVDLDVGFRYSQQLLDLSTTFVMKNPLQLRKAIRAFSGSDQSRPLTVLFSSGSSPDVSKRKALDEALADIVQRSEGHSPTVFILGRYHFEKPREFDEIKVFWKSRGRLQVEFHTIHSVKGKEADYVVIVGLESSEYGFPSNVTDDPVMRMTCPPKIGPGIMRVLGG